ncbi:hypothetical protein TrLO_g2301 [Triparma laevis f. longispina]|uniref:Uncharacterized protein n=1 Tax=Triparma laevis f. longispina TaxID=1714387 RepID=A0A9W7F9F0_9STRA|nr:hypothetical protein TrLO_g2301 [Triparma laevis f. longispina]
MSPSTPSKQDKDASIELRDFVYEVEASAKKILQKSAKKRMDQAIAQKNRERKEMFRGTSSSSKRRGDTHVSPGKKNNSNMMGMSGSGAYASAATTHDSRHGHDHGKSLRETVVLQIPAGMKGTLEQTSKYGFTPSPVTGGKRMKMDKASLSVTVTNMETVGPSPIKRKALNFENTNVRMPQATPIKTSLSSSMPPPPPRSPTHFPEPSPVGTPTTPIGGRNAGMKMTTPSPVKGIHGKLHKSPFFSQKMGREEKIKMAEHRQKTIKASAGAAGGSEVEEEVEDFQISRGIGSILAAKGKGKKSGKHQAKLAAALAAKKAGHSPKPHHEVQGPVSWASDHLRVKYRCEDRRLEAHESYLRALEEAKVLEREDGVIMAVASVERHPITQLYEELMALEMSRASSRARARNQMRRFVLDVHTVWITNLSGLEEHKSLDDSEGGGGRSKNNPGIPNRRDSEAIMNVSSQIQSVAVARSFEDAGVLMGDLEAEGDKRKEAFEKRKKEVLAGQKEPPRLAKPVKDPPEMWTLVSGERLNVPNVDVNNENKVMQESRIFVRRFRRQAKHGEDPLPPLWSATVFNVMTSEEVDIILQEEEVIQIVQHARQMERRRTTKALSQLADSDPSRATASESAQGTLVHRQGVRLACGDVMVGALASVFVRKSGPHIRVTVKLYFRGKTAFLEANKNTFYPPDYMTLETNTYVIIARLNKQQNVSALDFDFWSSSKNSDEIWRLFLPKLIFEKWKPPPMEVNPGLDVDEEKKDDPSQHSRLSNAHNLIKKDKDDHVKGKAKQKEKGGKKKKKKKKKGEGDGEVETVSATEFKKLEALTIPHNVAFEPTPPHTETDMTISIGGLTLDDIHEDAPLPGLVGMNDYYSAVSYGYELINSLKIVGDKLVAGGVKGEKERIETEKLTELENGGKGWAKEMEQAHAPLSLRISGRIGFHQICPGVTTIGRKGLWWTTGRREGQPLENEDRTIEVEMTRPVANYLRDSNLSSSMSVLVNCLLALESPLLAPLLMCWEPLAANPPPAPHLEVECIVPMFMNTPNTLLHHPVESGLDDRVSPGILVLTRAEVPTDFIVKAKHGTKETHRRRHKMFTKENFRVKVFAELLFPDGVIPPYVFGVTKKGAQCNTTGVNGRNMWHSEQRCVEQLCRVRGPIDYLHVAKNDWADVTGGISNEPNVYTMHMYGYKMNELSRGGEKSFETAYNNVLDKREAKMKQEALAAKIEAGKLLMEKKRAEQELMVRQEGLKKFEYMARGTGKIGEGLSTRAWQKRVKRSVTLSFQAVGGQGWERRLDPKHNQVFFHDTDPDSNNLKSLLDDDVESTGSEVERMVDQLSQNDDFIRMIAKKLGVPEHQLRGINRDIPPNPREDETSRSEGFREEGMKKPGIVTMAGETELADDDDGWSDSDDEVGGVGEMVEEPRDGMFPQDHIDNRREFVEDRALQADYDTRFIPKEKEWKSIEDGGKKKMMIPKLPIEGKINEVAPLESLEAHVGVRGYGWRRLGKEKVTPSFYQMKEHKIEKCSGDLFNKPSKASMVGMVDPKDAVDHSVDEDIFMKTGYESMFIRNVLDDIDRCNKMTEVRVQREKMLMDDSINSLQEIINVQPSEFTTVDQMIMNDTDERGEEDIARDNAHKAILAVKNANFDDLETVLDEDVQIDTKDEYGNTLLILACQQGNKRMSKFLLRRGATINQQNNLGNTLLHYLHEYKNDSLFEYMKQKGADDSFVNADGCTCYEGLKKDAVDNI